MGQRDGRPGIALDREEVLRLRAAHQERAKVLKQAGYRRRANPKKKPPSIDWEYWEALAARKAGRGAGVVRWNPVLVRVGGLKLASEAMIGEWENIRARRPEWVGETKGEQSERCPTK